ncbi:adenylate isopentenyltransferase 5, chloroplastic-like [Capsicum annuum]|uniref:adenylate isopentenyltransferase 5, chloroplastic-like n=1 Tax=Capsicum annuum TaxID=4072 RepID=UPI001FB095BE|nr:adenylate isopentenyltransferase 5, chloroplastic-like [Capsicum annuum]
MATKVDLDIIGTMCTMGPMDTNGHHWHHGRHKHQRHTVVPCTKTPSPSTAGALCIRHLCTTITMQSCDELHAPCIKSRILRKMHTFINNIIKWNTNKVVFKMGATGKSRLSVDLTIHFSAEIINSDKMQVYKGLDIVTNKITDTKKQGVTHYLLGEIDSDFDFTFENFCAQANCYIEKIISRGYVSIIIDGSNSYIEKLVKDPMFIFKSKYNSCFIWIDVDVSILDPFLRKKVDHMVQTGLVDEVRGIFSPEADYSKGIRQSIGVPEMDKYFREENKFDPCKDSTKKMLLESAVKENKVNTCNLVRHQLEKI